MPITQLFRKQRTGGLWLETSQDKKKKKRSQKYPRQKGLAE
jgi:hypothetical protein